MSDDQDPAVPCGHGPADACRCRLQLPADAEDMHVYAHEFDPIGGYVCSACGASTESEPCKDHQPMKHKSLEWYRAHARDGALAEAARLDWEEYWAATDRTPMKGTDQ